ncbi:MAG: hypothetical protein HN413_06365 [Chloroflexi bacterium]|jgi:uncharacterized membrane protein YeaQ/YmgE (transglycosylase-associated protein family)|nr:hypothetical protein [Chloroflexota bacterium]
MTIFYLVLAMIVVGLTVGWVAGLIWKDNRPFGVQGDFVVAVIAAIAIGLMDWYVIPAMGFSPMMRNIGLATEPALGALAVLWLIRVAKKQ